MYGDYYAMSLLKSGEFTPPPVYNYINNIRLLYKEKEKKNLHAS